MGATQTCTEREKDPSDKSKTFSLKDFVNAMPDLPTEQ
jgi:hypothetical protein